MKLAGAVLVLGGSLLLRWMQLAERSRQRRLMGELLDALRQMAEEIRMAGTPLRELFSKLSRRYSGGADAFFHGICVRLSAGELLAEAWENALAEMELPAAQKEMFAQLGSNLQGDEECICKAIGLVIHSVEISLEDWGRNRADIEKRNTGVLLCGAAMAVILLV